MFESLPSKKKISTAKAAQLLGVSRWTLRRWGNKKLLPFTTSRSGYRYYKEEDLNALKEKHSIVRIVSKKPKSNIQGKTPAVVSASRDETLLLPPAPKPKMEEIQKIQEKIAVHVDTAKPAKLVVPPPPSIAAGTFDVPPPPPPPKQRKSVFSYLWKILPFTGAAIFLLFVFIPTKSQPHEAKQAQNILTVAIEKPSSIFSYLSFRDVVLAAATDSSDLTGSSVRFFLSGDTESVDRMLSPDGEIPQSGNTIYLSSMTNFASFQDSPFAYLNGSHGPAGPVAIIDNADILRSHPFFANVHNGDKLLIYKESAKAVLFRPLTNEVIAFAPLDAVPSSSYEQIDGQPVVALRNGMGTPYDMKTFEAELTYIEPKSVVVDNENASRGDYPKSLILDVVGNKKAEAQTLAYKLRLTVSDLPVGEFRPPAGVDFLVILGKDRVPFMNSIAPSASASATPKQ
ncbi:helix-turn-helix domain-containing protein [Patescibacteria group bacterium]|nr:helix-turn-helix domain-containing protein [Patescibacteria group bacterium]